MQAVAILTLRQIRELHAEQFLQSAKLIPGIVSEANGIEVINEERVSQDTCLKVVDIRRLLEIFKSEFGRKHWRRNVKDMGDEDLCDILLDQYQSSKFDTFKWKVMDDIAPSCGRRVLHKHIKIALQEITEIVQSMTLKMDWFFLSKNSFQMQQNSCLLDLRDLRQGLDSVLPAVFSDHVKAFKFELLELQKTYTSRMVTKFDLSTKRLYENRRAIGGFALNSPPERVQLEKCPYLSSVKDEFYWEVKESEFKQLQRSLKEYLEKELAGTHESWTLEAKSLLEKSVFKLKANLFEALKGLTSESLAWMNGPDAKELSLKHIQYLDLPYNDMTNIAELKKKRKVLCNACLVVDANFVLYC